MASRRLARLALRDAILAAVTLGLWLLDARLRGSGGALAAALGVATGVFTAVCGFLVHEWGHLAGAVSAGALVHPGQRLTSLFLFRFDCSRNGRDAFLRMSYGGFAASAVAVLALCLLLPLGALSGRVALALVAAGVVATFVLEVPVAWRVAHGGALPTGAATVSADDLARSS